MAFKIIFSSEELTSLSPEDRKVAYIDEGVTNQILIEDNGEPCIEVDNLFKNAHIPVFYWEQGSHLLRKGAAERLISAAKNLPEGIFFKVYTTIRPVERQRELFNEVTEAVTRHYPEYSPKEVWSEVTKVIADPDGCAPHMTGGALDITLCDKDGNEMDMGDVVNAVESTGLHYTYVDHVSDLVKSNRKMLVSALEQVGFINLPTEWWHFSYGDQYWAAVQNEPAAIYGKSKECELPMENGRLYT